MDRRRIEAALPEDRVIDDGDMLLRRALPVEARASLGPFVMDAPERIVQAKRDFLGGRTGRLDGVTF